MHPADWIGWISSAILLTTISRQVYVQYRERATGGVSGWLFVGQLAASTGFVIYSALLANWVFVITNAALLVTALAGQIIYRRNRRREENSPANRPAKNL